MRDIQGWSVQQSPCLTCPFAGAKPLQLSQARYAEVLQNLMGNGQHICHTTDSTICRGGRDIQLRYLTAINAIAEPTDTAFDAAMEYYLGDESES